MTRFTKLSAKHVDTLGQKRDADSGMAYFDQTIIRDEDKAEDAAEVPKPAPPA